MPNVGLRTLRQDNFSAGMFRAVARHLIPKNGVYDHLNGLHDDDGSTYRRGGSAYVTLDRLGGSGLRWIWDGHLSPGARTLVASATNWGVLGVSDLSLVDLGAGGLSAPTRAVKVGDLLFIGGGAIYGGSRQQADYSTGTVTATAASTAVVGSGTSWSSNVDAGMLMRVGSERVYVVASVQDNTHLTLTEPYQGSTGSGKAATFKRIETASAPYKAGGIVASIFGRLLVAVGNKLYFSAGVDDTSGLTQPHSFAATDFHTFDGDILGVEPLRDVVFVFTTAGVFVVLGMAYDMLDPSGVNFQQRIEPVTRDVVLWAKEGVATHGNSLIVPAVDGVYRMGVASQPELLSRSVAPYYQALVRAGYKPGLAAVYHGHYVLPVLDANNAVVNLLVCRADRPVETGLGVVYPWSRWDGHAANVTALAVRVGGASSARSPNLLGASGAVLPTGTIYAEGSCVLKLGGCWEPSGARKADADGTAPQYLLETRDYATGSGNLNHARRCRLTYELVDAGTDDPVISGSYSKGAPATGVPSWDDVTWDDFQWASDDDSEFLAMSGEAPEDYGRQPFSWMFAARTRYIRYRFVATDPCASLRVRSVETFVRPAGNDR